MVIMNKVLVLCCSGCFFFCHDSLDFSGRSGPRQIRGYTTKTEYEMLGDGTTKETPQNKFNRLQHEIRELAEELEHIKVSSLHLLIVAKVKTSQQMKVFVKS